MARENTQGGYEVAQGQLKLRRKWADLPGAPRPSLIGLSRVFISAIFHLSNSTTTPQPAHSSPPHPNHSTPYSERRQSLLTRAKRTSQLHNPAPPSAPHHSRSLITSPPTASPPPAYPNPHPDLYPNPPTRILPRAQAHPRPPSPRPLSPTAEATEKKRTLRATKPQQIALRSYHKVGLIYSVMKLQNVDKTVVASSCFARGHESRYHVSSLPPPRRVMPLYLYENRTLVSESHIIV